MSWERGLTVRLVEEVAEAVEELSREPKHLFLDPRVAVASAIIMACALSFSRGLLVPALGLCLSCLLALALKVRPKAWARPVLFTAFITLGVSAPLPFIVQGATVARLVLGPVSLAVSAEGLREMLALTLRAMAAASAFTALTAHLGWRRLLEGLRGLGLPRGLVFTVGLYIRYIPVFLRDVVRLVAAREARLMRRGGRRGVWRALSTAVGELVIRGYERAWRLSMAMEARLMGGELAYHGGCSKGLSLADYVVLLLALLITCTALLVEV